jgi:hypothetical protein
MPQDLWDFFRSEGTYYIARFFLAGDLAFQRDFQEKVVLEIKNPASSAGHSHLSIAVAPREARQFLARARKVPHSRI